MKKERNKVGMESKIQLILLAIGLSLIMFIVVTHEEVRKGYVSTEDIRTGNSEVAETVDNIDDNAIERRITEKVEKIISQEVFLDDQKVEIMWVSNFENTTMATFIYDQGESTYEGICQISDEDKVIFKAVDKVNYFEPFTLHEVEFKKENIPVCTVIYGVVNNPVIKSININFYDKTMVNILLGDEAGYFYSSEEYSVPIIRVEGLDANLNIFYQWDKIYLNNV